MSTSCKDKDAAWDFIRRYFLPDSKSVPGMMALREKSPGIRIPLNKIAYRLTVMADQQYDRTIFYPLYPSSKAPQVMLPNPTDKDARDFYMLVDNTTHLYWPENQITEAVWDAIGPYFSGDKTMDEVIDLVQRRVQLYVNEQR